MCGRVAAELVSLAGDWLGCFLLAEDQMAIVPSDQTGDRAGGGKRPLSLFPHKTHLIFRSGVKQAIGVFFLAALFVPLFARAVHATWLAKIDDWQKLLYGVAIALAYPVWSWWETIAFERWIRGQEDATIAERERKYFKEMRDHAKTFWAALVAIFAAALLKLS